MWLMQSYKRGAQSVQQFFLCLRPGIALESPLIAQLVSCRPITALLISGQPGRNPSQAEKQATGLAHLQTRFFFCKTQHPAPLKLMTRLQDGQTQAVAVLACSNCSGPGSTCSWTFFRDAVAESSMRFTKRAAVSFKPRCLV